MIVSRKDVLERTSERSGIPMRQLEAAVKGVLDTISEALLEKDSVQFRGFGTFELRERSAAVRTNPRTGAPMEIPDRLTVGFVPSSTLKSLLNP